MQKLAILAAFTVFLGLFPGCAQAQETGEASRLRAQIDLLTKENELLKKENEILKKELALLKKEGAGKPGPITKPGGSAKDTIDDVEYEFVSLKIRNHDECVLQIALTSRNGSKRPRLHLPSQVSAYTASGTECIFRPQAADARNSLEEGVRVIFVLEAVNFPKDIGEFASIRINRGIASARGSTGQGQGKPAILKGSFPVEGR